MADGRMSGGRTDGWLPKNVFQPFLSPFLSPTPQQKFAKNHSFFKIMQTFII
jgi:hypothetical protein